MFRPVNEDPKLWFMALSGSAVDHERALADSAYLHECLAEATKNPEITISKVRSLAEWRLKARTKANHTRVAVGMLPEIADHFSFCPAMSTASDGTWKFITIALETLNHHTCLSLFRCRPS